MAFLEASVEASAPRMSTSAPCSLRVPGLLRNGPVLRSIPVFLFPNLVPSCGCCLQGKKNVFSLGHSDFVGVAVSFFKQALFSRPGQGPEQDRNGPGARVSPEQDRRRHGQRPELFERGK